jgi:hypothetical protein
MLANAIHRLADRAEHDSPQKKTYEAISIEEWLAKESDLHPRQFGIRRATTFAPLGERSFLDRSKCETSSENGQQPRGLRYLPFTQTTFQEICEKFQVHRSIVRAVSRSDVPTISCDRVDMDGPALGMIAYQCRQCVFLANYLCLVKFTIAGLPTPGITIWPCQQRTTLKVD